MNNTYSLIMAGGVGSRFWPMSTQDHPKQFLDVLGIGKSLLRLTFERMLALSPAKQIYILTNADYKGLVLQQLPEIEEGQVICEPERKNTAPCIAFASSKIMDLNPQATLIITPSDHLILNTQSFNACIHNAIEEAQKDKLVTLGIQPSRPDTGYGYIEITAKEKKSGDVFSVNRFCEKPNLQLAENFLISGNYLWNSGIFIWRAEVIMEAFKIHQKPIFDLFCSDRSAYNQLGEHDFMCSSFAKCEDISIDYAVMEHAQNTSVVISDFDWSDLGTWGSLVEHMSMDNQRNTVVGKQVHMVDSENCLVHMPDDKVVLMDGLNDLIVVESHGKLMIIRKDKESNLKLALKQMSDINPSALK